MGHTIQPKNLFVIGISILIIGSAIYGSQTDWKFLKNGKFQAQESATLQNKDTQEQLVPPPPHAVLSGIITSISKDTFQLKPQFSSREYIVSVTKKTRIVRYGKTGWSSVVQPIVIQFSDVRKGVNINVITTDSDTANKITAETIEIQSE